MLDLPYGVVEKLSEDGSLREGKVVDIPDEQLRQLYRWMLLGRSLDERALRLQRQGRLGTFAPVSGQEAAQVGSACLLEEGDWMFRSYRETVASIVFGANPKDFLLYSMGNATGGREPERINLFPVSIQIATQIPHATGAAWASKLKGEDRIAIAYFGDGATSKGDFHEALNFAAVMKVPVIFFCQNNQWAISVPVAKQMATPTIAQKALAYGLEGVRVDGNDLLAVQEVTDEAVRRARAGEGPTLIEALTYRVGPHTTSDDPTRYHDARTHSEWQGRDPIKRFRVFLERRDLWSEADEEKAMAEIQAEVATAVEAAEATPKTTTAQLIEHTFAVPTEELARQHEAVRAVAGEEE